MQPTPVFLPGKSHGQRESWWATVLGVAKEPDMTQQLNNINNKQPTQKSWWLNTAKIYWLLAYHIQSESGWGMSVFLFTCTQGLGLIETIPSWSLLGHMPLWEENSHLLFIASALNYSHLAHSSLIRTGHMTLPNCKGLEIWGNTWSI